MAAGTALAQVPVPPPVSVVVDGRLAVTAPAGTGEVPIFLSQDWAQPRPGLTRAVITIHGYERNAADYAAAMQSLAANHPDTLVVAPQFLAAEDIAAHGLPDTILRWQRGVWADGRSADGPAPLSVYDALDALLARLADRASLPDLSEIVLAGFSAGGQLVQRYAAVGRGEAAFGRSGIRLRYIVGSPSSYVYFDDERPAEGGFAPFAGAAACPLYNHWKYGFAADLPPYVVAANAAGVAALERRYAAREIVYLVGANDNDPHHRFLDTSCGAEAQGPDRHARALAFFADMRRRDGDMLRQELRVVDGVAHNEARVWGSPCGRAALFGEAGCPGLSP
jgi:hypothetical protein